MKINEFFKVFEMKIADKNKEISELKKVLILSHKGKHYSKKKKLFVR